MNASVGQKPLTSIDRTWHTTVHVSEKNNEDAIKASQVINFVNNGIVKRTSSLKDVGTSAYKDIEGDMLDAEEVDEIQQNNFFIPEIKNRLFLEYKNYFTKSQKWLGIVKDLEEKTFTAQLNDLNIPNSTFEIGEFDIAEVAQEDKQLLQKGAVFYFSIGRESRGGQITKTSLIRFQRVPYIGDNNNGNRKSKLGLTDEDLLWE